MPPVSELRSIEILEALASAGKAGLTLTDVAGRTGMPKATVYRILTALAAEHYVFRDPQTRRYQVGLRVLQLAGQVLDAMEIRTAALPHMRRLMQLTRETVHLILWDNGEGVYVEKIDCPQPVGLPSRIGKRTPAHASSAGKAMLAFRPPADTQLVVERGLTPLTEHTITDPLALYRELEAVRSAGYALDRMENRDGIICVASPVFDRYGQVGAAISVSAPAYRFSLEQAVAAAPAVVAAGAATATDLGYRPQS